MVTLRLPLLPRTPLSSQQGRPWRAATPLSFLSHHPLLQVHFLHTSSGPVLVFYTTLELNDAGLLLGEPESVSSAREVTNLAPSCATIQRSARERALGGVQKAGWAECGRSQGPNC